MKLAAEEAAEARAFYLQAWSGGAYAFDRIGRGTITLNDLRLSMIGGIQPGPLSELMHRARRGAGNDGMIERFLIAWPDAPREWRTVDRVPDHDAKRMVFEVFNRLNSLTPAQLRYRPAHGHHGERPGVVYLPFDGEAQARFSEWLEDHQRRVIRMRNAKAWKGLCRSSVVTCLLWRLPCIWSMVATAL